MRAASCRRTPKVQNSTVCSIVKVPNGSKGLLGLMILRVAASILPPEIKVPNTNMSYQEYYTNNLFRNDSGNTHEFLEWVKVYNEYTGYKAMQKIYNEQQIDLTMASEGTHHLGWLAAYTLMNLETTDKIKNEYENLIEYMYKPYADEFNSMYNFMYYASRQEKKDLNEETETAKRDALWSLENFPRDTIVSTLVFPITKTNGFTGADITLNNADDLGGIIGYKSHDEDPPSEIFLSPVPMLFRPKKAFCWQWSPRDFSPDRPGLRYSGIDYLFAYWLGRAHGIIPQSHIPSDLEFNITSVTGAKTYSAWNSITTTSAVTIEGGANVNFLSCNLITASSMVIKPGADVTFTAGNSITLKLGFWAQKGCNFHAYITPCSQ